MIATSITGGGGSGGIAQGSGAAIADNKLVRGDTPTGVQGSVVNLTDAGAVSGVTQLDVDNIRVDGNTISTTDSNGSLVLDPNGTGQILFGPDGGLTINADGDFTLANAAGSSFSRLRLKGGASLYSGGGAALRLQSDDGGTNWLRLGSGGIRLRADGQMGFVSASDLDAGPDAGMARGAAGVLLDTDGSSGLGARLTGRVVEASTAGSGAPNLLAATESRKLLTNEGSTAEAYHTLPLAAAGIEFVFYCQDIDGIRIVANTGDTIRIGASVSAAAGFVRSSTIGSVLILVAINATEWMAISVVGTWTVDV